MLISSPYYEFNLKRLPWVGGGLIQKRVSVDGIIQPLSHYQPVYVFASAYP